jgi:hypothetical protein
MTQKERSARWRNKNPERAKELDKLHRLKRTKEKQHEYDQRNYAKRKEKILEQAKVYYIENKEVIKLKKKNYRTANIEKCKLMNKKYYMKNSETYQKYREDNRDYFENARLSSLYGITLDEYDSMLLNQDGKCKICNIDQSELKESLHVDHDHINGKVRGLLCRKCNLALGCMNDDITILQKAITYLQSAT